ncbi:NRDE family protein [Mangrovimicrobium sediminis]|uniref:NRDE family protein n=2 Tax=Mangrovimicrobium sediminis TaxID=2562682 RepID=A0A4Z0M839_9GAMM|nr:NRDE family protein [Haliea sp. SAOS-164]
MCLIVLAHRCSQRYPLALVANRDEFHARPTAAAAFWPEHPQVLAGRDLQAGGTWLGVTRGGRLAAITNFRDPSRTAPAPRSRGELTLDFLTGSLSPGDYIAQIETRFADYAGFNLLLGAGDELWYASNAGGGARRLDPGFYGLSNALLDTPWPKVETARRQLRQVLEQPLDHDALAGTLADRQQARESELALQGLEGEMERKFSAQFIVDPVYGTRACTSLWRDAQGTLHWREQAFAADGGAAGCVEQRLAPALS